MADLVSRDHVVFFRHREELRALTAYLGGERFARLSEKGEPTVALEDLAIYRSRDVVALRRRVQPHPPGPTAGKLYKHGGLSLMEMLTPWLVILR